MFGEVTGEKLLHGKTLLGFFQHMCGKMHA